MWILSCPTWKGEGSKKFPETMLEKPKKLESQKIFQRNRKEPRDDIVVSINPDEFCSRWLVFLDTGVGNRWKSRPLLFLFVVLTAVERRKEKWRWKETVLGRKENGGELEERGHWMVKNLKCLSA